MEIKVKFKNGRIENHSIPPLVGTSTSCCVAGGAKEESTSDIDSITDIVEQFSRSPRGFHLERFVVVDGRKTVSANASRGYTVVPAAQLSDVKQILVDGETIYPDHPDKENELDKAIERLNGLLS